ncbi:MAG: hypothetical protein WKF58_12075 [Ilumatobacteraceae bacterium]
MGADDAATVLAAASSSAAGAAASVVADAGPEPPPAYGMVVSAGGAGARTSHHAATAMTATASAVVASRHGPNHDAHPVNRCTQAGAVPGRAGTAGPRGSSVSPSRRSCIVPRTGGAGAARTAAEGKR